LLVYLAARLKGHLQRPQAHTDHMYSAVQSQYNKVIHMGISPSPHLCDDRELYSIARSLSSYYRLTKYWTFIAYMLCKHI
jgi:hypothetical protein